MIVKFANKIGKLHGQFFLWLSKKAESHPLWAWALTLWALYEKGTDRLKEMLGPYCNFGKEGRPPKPHVRHYWTGDK